jgi:predicted transcriptional regulator
MKAIIEIAKQGSALRAVRQQIKTSQQGHAADFLLFFESARTLFTELTPARLDLLDTLSKLGSCSVYALAKAAARNYSNVHTDITRLEELGLVERTTDDNITVPFTAVEIRMPFAQAA